MPETRSPIDGGQAVAYGWTTVKKDLWYFVVIALIFMVVGSIGSTPKGWSGWDVVNFFLTAWITCGLMAILLSYEQGKKLHISELFTHTEHYWRVLGATFLVTVIVSFGLVLLIVPGIYFALKYQFTVPLIIDQGLGVGDALRASERLTNGRKMSLLQFDLMALGVICLGALALGVGMLIAVPVVWLAYIAIYRKLT